MAPGRNSQESAEAKIIEEVETMKEVRWLAEVNTQCEAELASDEMDQWKSGIKCSKMAQVQIIFNSGMFQRTCHHHYITRTAFPERKIQGTPIGK